MCQISISNFSKKQQEAQDIDLAEFFEDVKFIHSVLMSVELIAFGHVKWKLSKFPFAKDPFFASKGK